MKLLIHIVHIVEYVLLLPDITFTSLSLCSALYRQFAHSSCPVHVYYVCMEVQLWPWLLILLPLRDVRKQRAASFNPWCPVAFRFYSMEQTLLCVSCSFISPCLAPNKFLTKLFLIMVFIKISFVDLVARKRKIARIIKKKIAIRIERHSENSQKDLSAVTLTC